MPPVYGTFAIVDLFGRFDTVIFQIDLYDVRTVEYKSPLAFASLVEFSHEAIKYVPVLKAMSRPIPIGTR